jgi:hypothetical protein
MEIIDHYLGLLQIVKTLYREQTDVTGACSDNIHNAFFLFHKGCILAQRLWRDVSVGWFSVLLYTVRSAKKSDPAVQLKDIHRITQFQVMKPAQGDFLLVSLFPSAQAR